MFLNSVKKTIISSFFTVFDENFGLEVNETRHFAGVEGDFHATYRHSSRDVIEINRSLCDAVV